MKYNRKINHFTKKHIIAEYKTKMYQLVIFIRFIITINNFLRRYSFVLKFYIHLPKIT